MNVKLLANIFGWAFLAIGVLGFVPGVTNDDNLLLGIFQVSALHNVIHLVSGLAALYAAKTAEYAKVYFQVFGVVYALVAVAGLVQGNTVLGLIDVNAADNVLHVLIAVAALAIGFSPSGETGPAPAPQQ